MKTFKKSYRSPFVVDKSKLTRLLSVVKDKLSLPGLEYGERFEAHLANAKTVSTSSLNDVFELDNSRKSRIVRLFVAGHASKQGATTPEHEIEIEFDGRSPVDVNILVKSDDSKLASEGSAIVEEQVERTLQSTVMAKIRNRPEMLAPVVGMLVGVLLVAVAIPLFLSTVKDLDVANPVIRMWLTNEDIAKLRERFKDSARLSADEIAELQTRQLRNVVAATERAPKSRPFLEGLPLWRTLFLVLPFLIVGGTLVYGWAVCYPPAVFLWGDAEEWYAGLVARRKAMWSIIVIALIIGIVSNLFVLGVANTLKG